MRLALIALAITLVVVLNVSSAAAQSTGSAPAVPGATSAPPSAGTPTPQLGQPGRTAAARPGAAQSANSDGYAECMSLWNPTYAGMSRADWAGTCERAKLPPKR